jgi:hypothetical protein
MKLKKLYFAALYSPLDVWEKIWRNASKWWLFKTAYFGFQKRSSLSKHVVTEFKMEKIRLQIMRSDVGWSNFKSLEGFCTEKEREDQALRRKMFSQSPHLTCHERRACWSCLAFCSTDSTGNKTFWVTVKAHGNSDNNSESPCIIIEIKHIKYCYNICTCTNKVKGKFTSVPN